MSRVKHYRNLKLAATSAGAEAAGAGPYSLGISATLYAACVPCLGASQVRWTVRGTGAGGLANTVTVYGTNEQGGTLVLNAGTCEWTVIGEGGGSIGGAGGAPYSIVMTLANARIHLGFAQLVVINDANAKTAVSVEAEVWYDTEADVTRRDVEQAGVEPYTY